MPEDVNEEISFSPQGEPASSSSISYKSKPYLSVSSLEDFERCPRRFFFKHGLRLKPITGYGEPEEGEAGPLGFGSCLHEALPYALAGDLKRSMEQFESSWNSDYDDAKHSVEKARMMLATYHAKRADGKASYEALDPPKGRIQIKDASEFEVPFALDLGVDIPFTGIIDRSVRIKATGQLAPMDYKTSSRKMYNPHSLFRLHPQTAGYTLALSILTGEPCNMMVIEVLTKTKNPDLETILIDVPESNQQDFVEEFRAAVEGINACESQDHWPKKLTGCSGYPMFGCTWGQCEFQELCQMSDWTDGLGLYEVREPSHFVPLTVEGETK